MDRKKCNSDNWAGKTLIIICIEKCERCTFFSCRSIDPSLCTTKPDPLQQHMCVHYVSRRGVPVGSCVCGDWAGRPDRGPDREPTGTSQSAPVLRGSIPLSVVGKRRETVCVLRLKKKQRLLNYICLSVAINLRKAPRSPSTLALVISTN